MTTKKRAAALIAAVLLAATTVSGPATAFAGPVQEALPAEPALENIGAVVDDTMSADIADAPASVSGDTDWTAGEGQVIPGDGADGNAGGVPEGVKREEHGEDKEEVIEAVPEEVIEERPEGIIEEIMEEIPGEGNAPEIDAAGYTGRVAPEDLLDQEKLDQALADGLVELIPPADSVNEEYQRAGAANGNIIDVASREVGVSGRPNKYTYWLGSISGTYAYAWCHAFVSWCGAQAGSDQVPRSASCFYGAQAFKARGQWKNRISGYVPKAGDIIYFDWNANGSYDHVGIVHYVSGGRVHTIEGNASDAVRYDGGRTGGYALTDSQIIGYGTPSYVTIPQDAQTRGCLDEVTGGNGKVTVRGWAFDREDLARALDIHVYVGGEAGSGAPGHTIRADKDRPDVDAVYPGVGEQHGFEATVYTSASGTLPIYVYAVSAGAGKKETLIGYGTAQVQKDAEKPKISSVKVSGITVEGYTVTCKVTDNVAVEKVEFPSWHESKSGDQAVWFKGTVENGVATCFIPISKLGGQSGTYTTHIYAYDRSGNYALAGAEEVAIDLADLQQYEIQNLSTGFIARIEDVKSKKALTGQLESRTVSIRTDTGAAEQVWAFARDKDYSYSIQLSADSAYLAVGQADSVSSDSLAASDVSGTANATLADGQTKIPLWRVRKADEDSCYLELADGSGRVLTQGDTQQGQDIREDAPVVRLEAFGAQEGQRFKIQKLSTNVTKLSLKKETLTFTEPQQTEQLAVTVKPKSAADEKICWASSDERAASVDKDGLVKAIGNGTADITASTEDGSMTATCKVTVQIKPTGVKLNKEKVTLNAKGATKKLRATVTPENAKDKTVTWSSSDAKVASVDQSGLVKAVSNGTAVITAETVDGKLTDKCTVTVQIPKVGAGGTIKSGSYTYTADHIISSAGDKTIIYRQKKNSSKEKMAQIGAKVYLQRVYAKKLYYEQAKKGGRDLYAIDTGTFTKQLIRKDSVIAAEQGRKLIVKPYAAKIKKQTYYILDTVTGKEKTLSTKCLGAVLTKTKIYYAEAVSGKTGKGWKVKIRSCNLSAGKKKDLTGKITVEACETITARSVTYRSQGRRYQYTYSTKKRKKLS